MKRVILALAPGLAALASAHAQAPQPPGVEARAA